MSMRLSGVSPEVQEHVAGVIESAANYIAENGWHRGDFYGPGSSACAATALMIAGGHISSPRGWQLLVDAGSDADDEYLAIENDLAMVAFATYLRESFGAKARLAILGNTGVIWNWNDADGRTMDEVLTALMACAESLRAGVRAAA